MKNRQLEPFLEVCEELQSQRRMINNKIGQAKRFGKEIPVAELIAGHNESLQAAMYKFPDYELPLTVQLDVHSRDPQRLYHLELSSRLRRKFRTGRIHKQRYSKVENPITAQEKKREFQKTVQRLLARNRDCQII